jgi:superfamily I DNA/RNA helicase
MTIHQAKNREFDRVIVLWPYEVSGSEERKRRLAYNAITRAKAEAFVVVQGEARIGQPPFVSGSGASAVPNNSRRGGRRRASREPE